MILSRNKSTLSYVIKDILSCLLKDSLFEAKYSTNCLGKYYASVMQERKSNFIIPLNSTVVSTIFLLSAFKTIRELFKKLNFLLHYRGYRYITTKTQDFFSMWRAHRTNDKSNFYFSARKTNFKAKIIID